MRKLRRKLNLHGAVVVRPASEQHAGATCHFRRQAARSGGPSSKVILTSHVSKVKNVDTMTGRIVLVLKHRAKESKCPIPDMCDVQRRGFLSPCSGFP